MQPNTLVLYKNHPARITAIGQKIELLLPDGSTPKVREKDVVALHPGPFLEFAELTLPPGDIKTAWELLTGGDELPLGDLADLIFGDFTPASAWATWQLVRDGLYFNGTPTVARALSAAEVDEEKASRAKKLAEKARWENFIDRLQGKIAGKAASFAPEDAPFLAEIEAFALQQSGKCRVLPAIKRSETPENAHALLLQTGVWAETRNPYPERLGLFLSDPTTTLPALPDEPRRDLTHLPAFAIDDAGSNDPDDAISVDDNRLWVHVADAAALVAPETPADWEARARGANIYLPENVVPMLPDRARTELGLGLADQSPALSFGIDFDETGAIVQVEVCLSLICVTRLTYDEAEERMGERPLAQLGDIAQRNLARRIANGSIEIDLPETRVRVDEDGAIHIRPLPPLSSRTMVQEAMLIAGEAAAIYAQKHELPMPYSCQSPPRDGADKLPGGIAGMFGLRRLMRPSRRLATPNPHHGLGLPAYVQVTSPLRRYLDLVAHQQLRAHVRSAQPLDEATILGRIGAMSGLTRNIARAGRLSDQHWTLLYLRQNPGWRGEGVVVESNNNRSLILLPALALETTMHSRSALGLNKRVTLQFLEANLPALAAHFKLSHPGEGSG